MIVYLSVCKGMADGTRVHHTKKNPVTNHQFRRNPSREEIPSELNLDDVFAVLLSRRLSHSFHIRLIMKMY